MLSHLLSAILLATSNAPRRIRRKSSLPVGFILIGGSKTNLANVGVGRYTRIISMTVFLRLTKCVKRAGNAAALRHENSVVLEPLLCVMSTCPKSPLIPRIIGSNINTKIL